MFYFLLYDMENVCAHPGEAIVSDAKVLVISPVSNNSFIESVRLRSMRNARFKFVVDILSSFAISSNVALAKSPLWSFCLY